MNLNSYSMNWYDGHNFVKTESLFDTNTRNKKNGTVPEYLARNHDLGYGEDENIDKDKSDNKVTIIPSATSSCMSL